MEFLFHFSLGDDAHLAVGLGLPLDQRNLADEMLIARDLHIAPVEPAARLFPHLIAQPQIPVIR